VGGQIARRFHDREAAGDDHARDDRDQAPEDRYPPDHERGAIPVAARDAQRRSSHSTATFG
jgi:hypothetical protein